MSTTSIYSMDIGDVTANMNAAKDSVLEALINDGLLTREAGEAWRDTHHVVVYQRSWFKRFWKKDEADTPAFKVARFGGDGKP